MKYKYELAKYRVRLAYWKTLIFFFGDPFFILALTALLCWLGEGVAMQSGWVNCPRP